MKKIAIILTIIFVLTGCSQIHNQMDEMLKFRKEIENANSCSFLANIVADYGDALYQFSIRCAFNGTGDMNWEIVSPESITGIKGSVSGERGKFEFDDKAVAFELLADGQITPAASAWLLMRAMRSGYLKNAGTDGEFTRVSINDTFRNCEYSVDLWLTRDNIPIRGEILWMGRRILSIEIGDFVIS